MDYIKEERSVSTQAYKHLANDNPDIFNTLENKVTNKLSINIKPDSLKRYKEFISKGNQDNPDKDYKPSTNLQISDNETEMDLKNIDIKGKCKEIKKLK